MGWNDLTKNTTECFIEKFGWFNQGWFRGWFNIKADSFWAEKTKNTSSFTEITKN